MSRPLSRQYPVLAARCPAMALADLPTPVSCHRIEWRGRKAQVSVKHDETCGPLYGGNKVRKLEYLLQRASDCSAKRVATYGAAGSHHALATAIYARRAGFDCTCLLSHQVVKPQIAQTLLLHQQLGTELLAFGGPRQQRVQLQRTALQGRKVFLIPMGGSNWIGTLGFVNAALEFAAQLDDNDIPRPTRLYLPLGTMGTAVGLALGFALADLKIELHAIRVTDARVANPRALQRLLGKTATLMHRIDSSIPSGLAHRARIRFRDDFVGDGYGRSNTITDEAIGFARDALGLSLESTYTGKAMAALLHDINAEETHAPMFWNTYNNVGIEIREQAVADFSRLPESFGRYFAD